MNILIIGCGQLGSRLANVLDKQGHDISIIGSSQTMTDLLDDDFSGLTIPGNPIDSDVMKSAGIEGCDYVICVTESDNTNLMAAQVAKHIFHIDKIFVRVLDPVKCHVYKQMDISTISPTSLAFESICSAIFNTSGNKIVTLGKSSVAITTTPYEKWMHGKLISDIEYVKKYKLIGYLDENDRFLIFNHENDRKIEKTDRFVFTAIIEWRKG